MVNEVLTEQGKSLIATGLSLGLVHVLAGPDHLSALAALSVGTSYKAFMLGVRWGIGHSTGLIAVAIVFILLKGDLDLRTMGRYCDTLVGIFMICLGCYGVVSAIRSYREKRMKRDYSGMKISSTVSATHVPGSFNRYRQIANHEKEKLISTTSSLPKSSSNIDLSPGSSLVGSSNESSPSSASEGPLKKRVVADGDPEACRSVNTSSTSTIEGNQLDPLHEDHYIEDCPWCPFINMHDPYTQRIISFCIGLLHGVAGPGGILGVLPAVEMQRWTSSCLYLGSFIIASTLSMGTFAALYGEATKRLGATAETMELALSIFSSALSIIVGSIWFVLSMLGKLDELFH